MLQELQHLNAGRRGGIRKRSCYRRSDRVPNEIREDDLEIGVAGFQFADELLQDHPVIDPQPASFGIQNPLSHWERVRVRVIKR